MMRILFGITLIGVGILAFFSPKSASKIIVDGVNKFHDRTGRT